MAGAAEFADTSTRAICDYCGDFIDEPGQRCLALDDRRCKP
jgi:hypothetical protein